MKKCMLFLWAGMLLILPFTVWGAVPKLINFQGVLRDSGGNVVADSTYSVTFTIYDAASGGIVLWTENQPVTTSNGLFGVLLGASNPVPDSVFQGSDRWLCIAVSPDLELSPRQQLVSVGYAYRVNSVDGALGGSILTKVSIGPGHTNTGTNAFVAGENNIANGDFATVGGGQYDTANGSYATVGGGLDNTAHGVYATIGGGDGNTVSDSHSTVGGGGSNTASFTGATVSGGYRNTASGGLSTIGGGGSNNATGQNSTIGGGYYSYTSFSYSTIAGGESNFAINNWATVGGGGSNTANGSAATVGGGKNNVASGGNSAIGGGYYNAVNSAYATIGGGYFNRASGVYAAVCGGGGNDARGNYSAVPGGFENLAVGNFSFANGRKAKALHLGTFVWADSSVDADFVSTAPNQFLIRASGGVGIGTISPNSKLHVDGPIATAVTSVTFSGGSGNFNVDASHSVIFVNVTENSPSGFTVTLPTATGISGREYTIKRIDATSGSLTLQSAGGLIDGTTTKTLTGQYRYLVVVSDGSDWFIVANN